MNKTISLLVLSVAFSLPAAAGTITGTVQAEGKAGADQTADGGDYESPKYKFAPKVDYDAMHDFVVYIDAPPATNTPAPKKLVQVVAMHKVAQRAASFSPHILPVMAGTTVEWPNQDSIYHNVFSYSDAKSFDLGLYKGNPADKRVTFDQTGRVDVFCSIHANMNCVVLVLPNPYFASTDAHGHYAITNVPPGTYKLKAWHERLPGETREITVPADGEVKADFTLGIKILPDVLTMGKIQYGILISFRTKVIVPVVGVMVLLMAVSMWLVNERVSAQLAEDAARQLVTDEAVFKNSQEIRANHLILQYRNMVSEARFKALAELVDADHNHLSAEEQNTIREELNELVGENVAEVIMFWTGGNPAADPITVARNPGLDVNEFEANCVLLAKDSLRGQPRVGTVKNGDRLLDIVSIPVRTADNTIIGSVTFGVENSVAQEFNQLTHIDILLISNGQVMASTLQTPVSSRQLSAQIARASSPQLNKSDGGAIEQLMQANEHYLALAGSLSTPDDPQKLNYLLLYSYEPALRVLRGTQHLILGVGLVAILLGAGVVSFLVRKVTEPLQELYDSVEAVSQGDLSRRIEVKSMDECGALAQAFNQMTENLKNSREQLESTVESLRTTQAQLVQTEKLAGIGEFVSGVAHELNNPLTSVMGFSELLMQMHSEPQLRRHLDMIFKSAQRCQKIVQALLSFARKHQPERKPVCVNNLIDAALEILIYQLRTSNIEVRIKLDPDLPMAMVDPHQMQQVFLNIINNARQAIEAHQPGGWVKITTESRGPNVHVTFQDSGPGIKPENLSKLFDPFFTTKEVGKGTGLGLSLCYGIVKEHGGTITPKSKPGEGATFIIELPITHVEAAPEEARRLPDTDVLNPREGLGRRVLVIDDEDAILQMVREVLTRRGYEVDIARDGETGLERLGKASYDVMLCDWKMPGINGREIYERVQATHSQMSDRIIFITGDVVNEHVQEFLAEHNKLCLAKPFSLADFREAIDKILPKAA